MARVYTARDAKHDRSVAIKVMHPTVANDVSAERFLREIRIAAQFSHPGIIGLIDSGSITIDGAVLPYYVMPRIDGETLRVRLERERQLNVDEAIDITRQIADALAYAHRHDVVHRDVKPENILLVGNRVLVADFGIARGLSHATASGLTTAGSMVGTPSYMSPEQVTDAKVGPTSDIFSLGVVLYELLTGELPFAGTWQAQVARRLHDTPTPVRKLRPAIPVALEQVVAKMLGRFPQDRFQSGDELVAALAQRPANTFRSRSFLGALAAVVVLVVFVWAASRFAGSRAGDAAPTPTPRSIAVLPFAIVGADESSAYFGDGIADEVAGALAKLPGLKVAARSSAFQFKGQNLDAKTVGERLGVAAVVEGSVRRMGNAIRISAQLIDASDGLLIWSESYERSADQVFNVQSNITTAIASSIGLRTARVAQTAVPNSRAYEAFLQGRWHWGKRDREGFERAVHYFQLALREDSLYAKAWAGLGDAYSLLGGFGYMAPDSAFGQARAAAMRAIALDSTLADAHTALGFVNLFYDFDWNGARKELERALQLDPQYGEARLFYAWYLLAMNQGNAAVDSLRATVRDEPVSLILNLRLGSILMLSGRRDEARKQLAHTLELSETYPLPHLDLARIAALEGDESEALEHLSRAPQLVASYGSGIRGYVLARSGKRKEALAEAARLAGSRGPSASALGAAQTYAALGDPDRAFLWLNRAYDNREWSLFFVRSDPLLVPLHADPRWAGFVSRMRFP